MSGGLHGDPQAEGYGGAVESELLAADGVDETRQGLVDGTAHGRRGVGAPRRPFACRRRR